MSTEVRQVGYDEVLGVYVRDNTPLAHVDRLGRRLGPTPEERVEYPAPIAVFFSRKHADYGWRDELHLTLDDASWLAGELLRHCRTRLPDLMSADVAAKQLHLVVDELATLRQRIDSLARGLEAQPA